MRWTYDEKTVKIIEKIKKRTRNMKNNGISCLRKPGNARSDILKFHCSRIVKKTVTPVHYCVGYPDIRY
jgi:hypothetical protein